MMHVSLYSVITPPPLIVDPHTLIPVRAAILVVLFFVILTFSFVPWHDRASETAARRKGCPFCATKRTVRPETISAVSFAWASVSSYWHTKSNGCSLLHLCRCGILLILIDESAYNPFSTAKSIHSNCKWFVPNVDEAFEQKSSEEVVSTSRAAMHAPLPNITVSCSSSNFPGEREHWWSGIVRDANDRYSVQYQAALFDRT